MAGTAETLGERLQEKGATVGVLGLGYVGLPLALAFAEAGFRVLGFDVDQQKVEQLERGESYIGYLPSSRIRGATGSGHLRATSDAARLSEADALVIAVPTPLDGNREPDLRYVVASVEAITAVLRSGQLIVLESTTYPGTTEEVVRPILERSGLRCGRDFFLAYSPEREDPGRKDVELRSIPKVVGGVDEPSLALAASLYAGIVERVVEVSSTQVAEAAKLTENIYRAVNIGLVNELKMVYDRMGVDIWEVLAAAETKPFGFHRFNPGPGWGGHCIPIDPFYLAWKAKQVGTEARFVNLAGTINVEMPSWVLERIEMGLNREGVDLRGSKILLLGVAYKKNVGDPRESPAFELLARLCDSGCTVDYHDPHVRRLPAMRSWPDLPRLESVALTQSTLAAYDAVVVVTDHDDVDYETVYQHARLVVDTRGVYRGRGDRVVHA